MCTLEVCDVTMYVKCSEQVEILWGGDDATVSSVYANVSWIFAPKGDMFSSGSFIHEYCIPLQ